MTAHITQNVARRSRSDFRASLKWVRHIKPERKSAHVSPTVSFQARAIGKQLGSINHSTITLSLGLLAVVTVALLGFFYLQQVLSTASQGSDIHALESKITDLREQQRQLELQGAELRSIKTIEGNIEKLNLVATDKVSYLAQTTDKVALNNESVARVLP